MVLKLEINLSNTKDKLEIHRIIQMDLTILITIEIQNLLWNREKSISLIMV